MMMDRRTFLGLAGALALMPVTPAAASTPYTDPLGRYTLLVPDDWVADMTTVAAIIGAWSTNGGTTRFTVLYTQVNTGTTAEDLEAGFLPAITGLPGYAENERRYVTLLDGDVPLIDYYTTEASDTSVRVQQLFLTHGLDGFVLGFRSPAADAPAYATVVGAMIGSFTYTLR